jgi:hypothetical protein
MWFNDLMGFTEENPNQVQNNIEVSGNKLISKVNNQSFIYGELTTPSLNELIITSQSLIAFNDNIKLSEVVGNVQTLHCLEENNGAFFQAASQFNLLEMVSPDVTPEEGVGRYEYDRTQGPACAIACGAGTIYRNYFADVNGRVGQTFDNQIDCLKEIGIALENDKLGLWKMSNGYALATSDGLKHINTILEKSSIEEYERLKGLLRIGIQSDTQVTINNSSNFVSQAYCSALPIAYTNVNLSLWERFARLVLEATYEATIYAALNNYQKTNNNKVFLTLVGGGVFGNKIEWILDSIEKALIKLKKTPLDVMIVSYGSSNSYVRKFVDTFNLTN